MATMSKRAKAFIDFKRGRNDSASAETIHPEEVREAINVDLSMRGGYSQRKGCTKATANSLGAFPVEELIRYPGKKLALCGTTLKDWAGNVIKSGLSVNGVSAVLFPNGKLYFVDGVEYYVYDGATVTAVVPASGADLTAIKRCRKLIVRGQRLFAFGDPNNPNYLYFSESGDPTNFKAANIVKAMSDDSFGLTGAGLFSQALIAAKARSLYSWTGWDPATDVRFDPLDVDTGTVAGKSLVRADSYMMYLANDGIRALYGTDSGRIQAMRVTPGSTELITKLKNRNKAVGIFHNGRYLLACCDQDTPENNLVLVGYVNMMYSAEDDESGKTLVMPCTVIRGWNVASWFVDDDDVLYFGSSKADGLIYKAFDSYNDDGVAIVSQVTHRFNITNSFQVKKVKSLLVLGRQMQEGPTNIKVSLNLGYKVVTCDINFNESMVWDVSLWDEALWSFVDVVTKELPLSEACGRVELTITHDRLDEPMVIYGFSIVYKPKKVKGVRSGVTNKQVL